MKKLVELSVEDFLEAVASDCPAPGGGSVAAVEGAFAASLVEMVSRLTLGKEKFREHEALMSDALGEAYRLRTQFMDLTDLDTEAYDNVTAAYRMPKGTDEEKADRSSAIQHALKMATNIPLETMQRAQACLDLIGRIKGKINPNCDSDLNVAELSARASLEGAWQNVLTNLSGIRDTEFVEKTKNDCIMRGMVEGK